MFVAMVQTQDVAADKELATNGSTYLNRSVEAAKFLFPKLTAVIGESFAGEDDSDADE